MGYYTYYTLDMYKDKECAKQGIAFTDEEKQYEVANELYKIMYGEKEELLKDNYYGDYFSNIFCDSMKWYDHEEEMIKLSEKYPEYWFILEGHGEEWDDIWKMYVHNGNAEKVNVEIYFAEPNMFYEE